jgi:hypothetical protein
MRKAAQRAAFPEVDTPDQSTQLPGNQPYGLSSRVAGPALSTSHSA